VLARRQGPDRDVHVGVGPGADAHRLDGVVLEHVFQRPGQPNPVGIDRHVAGQLGQVGTGGPGGAAVTAADGPQFDRQAGLPGIEVGRSVTAAHHAEPDHRHADHAAAP